MLEALARISSGQKLSPEDEHDALDQLERHECWAPLFRYLDKTLASGGPSLVAAYGRSIRLRLKYFDEVPTAQALASDLVRRCKLDFPAFRDIVLNETVIPGMSAPKEAALLEAVGEAFSKVEDKVNALERLASVYEKRLFNDVRLHEVFERLLKLDPDNVKGLRYFKVAFSQNGDWEQVSRVLKRLISVVQAPQEKYRLAQDLAYNLVYHQDQPRDALLVLDRHCRQSPLDVSQIEFDAAFRLGDIGHCVKVLEGALAGVADDAGRSIIQFRMGDLLRKSGKPRDSEKYLRQSIATWRVFLDPFELLAGILIEERRWDELAVLLGELAGRIQDSELASQVKHAANRLQTGLAGKAGTPP